ncbi:MAG TPA: hypothetical protein VM032_06860 [Vicinamibacterales bacterium]|nr:hypothetical protein [Vicinamibacterales bacterium]
MNRVHFAVAATLISTTMFAGAVVAAQSTQLTPVLAGKKIVPPLRGEATIDITQPVTKPIPGKSLVQTTIKVKNTTPSPIARLQVAETWYDGGGAIIAGGRGVINGLLQPGEVGTITIETPYSPKMKSNNWNFTHANGTVKPNKVKSLDAPPADAVKK